MEHSFEFKKRRGILYIDRADISEQSHEECKKTKVIRGSGSTLRVSRKIIIGNGNEIHGIGNTVRGNYNTIYGPANEAIGIGNVKKPEPETEDSLLRRERGRKRDAPESSDRGSSSEGRGTMRATYHAFGDVGTMFSILSSVLNGPFVDLSTEPEPKKQKFLIPDEHEEEEDEDLEEKDACAICKVKRKTVTIVDCGHTMFCVECMRTLLNDTSKSQHKCPICSKEIVYGAQKIKLYE